MYLFTSADRSLQLIARPADLSLGPRLPYRGGLLERGVASWIDGATGTDPLVFHEAPLDGGAARAFAIDPTVPDGPYEQSNAGLPDRHRGDLGFFRGHLPNGMIFTGASALVWVRPSGAPALSVPFESVLRAGDGVAIGVSTYPRLTRVERWVGGRLVARVVPEFPTGHASNEELISADAAGFRVLLSRWSACAPGSGGLSSEIDAFSWTSPKPVRTETVGCARDGAGERVGRADASLATLAPDGSVLVPGADRDGVFVVRVTLDAPF